MVEEHVQVVNPKEPPLRRGGRAAGRRPRGAEPGARHGAARGQPTGVLTQAPTYVAFLDDQVAFYYDTLPAGTYDFYFRTRAPDAPAASCSPRPGPR